VRCCVSCGGHPGSAWMALSAPEGGRATPDSKGSRRAASNLRAPGPSCSGPVRVLPLLLFSRPFARSFLLAPRDPRTLRCDVWVSPPPPKLARRCQDFAGPRRAGRRLRSRGDPTRGPPSASATDAPSPARTRKAAPSPRSRPWARRRRRPRGQKPRRPRPPRGPRSTDAGSTACARARGLGVRALPPGALRAGDLRPGRAPRRGATPPPSTLPMCAGVTVARSESRN